MLPRVLKAQRGFTLMELLAVIAILTVLAGLVAGAVTGIGASGQNARLAGDQDTIGKAADRFFNDSFPQAYPVVSLAKTRTDIQEAGDLGVRLIDFEAVLPGNPTKAFVPDFLKKVPDTAALVSWRIVNATGQVFFAQDGAQLVRPSAARLDVSAVKDALGANATEPNKVAVQADYKLKLRLNKNEAALEILGMAIPANYSIGGQSLVKGTVVGSLKGTLSTDNPWSAGQVLDITGTLKATGQSNEWLLYLDYPNDVNNFKSTATVKARCDRSHKVSIATPSEEAAGAIKIEMATRCDATDNAEAASANDPLIEDPAQNQATENWELTIYGKAGGANVITNPSVKGVYRWLAAQHTTIDVGEAGQELFSSVSGNQAVVIKGETPTPTPAPTPAPTPTPTPAPTPTPSPATLVSIAVTPKTASISKGATQQFTAKGTLSDNTVQDITAQVSWLSSNTTVATIAPGGQATGVAPGTTQVTASKGDKTSPAVTLTVTSPPSAVVPFANTGDLYVLDQGSKNILRITPSGEASIGVTQAQIQAATGATSVSFFNRGLAFDAAGALYFTEGASGAILRRAKVGTLTVLTPKIAITAVAGGTGDPKAIAFGSDGFLYVNDDSSDSVLRVDPTSGAVSVYASKAAIQTGTGLGSVNLAGGIVGDDSGNIYVVSAPATGPHTVIKIAPGGAASIIASGSPFSDLDVFITRAASGDLLVADDSGADMVHRVTPAGVVTTFLAKETLELVTGPVDLEGGITFDSAGNFYLAEANSDNILRFDAALTGIAWVSAASIQAVTNAAPDLQGGIAFAPAP